MIKDIETLTHILSIKELLMNELRIVFEKEGLSSTEIMIIYLLQHQQQEFRASDLAIKLYLPMSTLTGIIDKMVEKEIVIRRHSDQDRRVVIIQLNPKFKERTMHYMAGLVNLMKEISGSFAPEWNQQFNDRLKTYRTVLEKRAQA